MGSVGQEADRGGIRGREGEATRCSLKRSNRLLGGLQDRAYCTNLSHGATETKMWEESIERNGQWCAV